MIKVTREMVQAIYSRIDFVNHGDDGIADGLADVFAIVERDYQVLSGRSAFPEGMHSHGAQCEDDCDVTWEDDMEPYAVEHPSGLRRYLSEETARENAERWKAEVLYRHRGVGLYLPTPDTATNMEGS